MKKFGLLLALVCSAACGPIRAVVTPTPPATHNVACVVTSSDRPVADATCTIGPLLAQTNGDGYHLFEGVPTGLQMMVGKKDGYSIGSAIFINDHDQDIGVTLVPNFPLPPSRQYVLDAHESFQGALLHTSQFGDLYWWPTAWTSLNAADQEASYAQIASWGDTDITVSASWNYGEPGQPYGTGQLVPNTDYAGNGQWDVFRAKVKDVIFHRAANGQPFVPRVFMEGDNGFSYYMWVMPHIIQALRPQPNDPIDLIPYVKLQMCYDSCVPGWQPKTQVADAILATRAACAECVIAMEFSSGYSSWGDGGANFLSDAGLALDEIDWEGNYWPVTNWDQYWQIFARLLGPAYHRPADQPAQDDPGAPYGADSPFYYLRQGTPRGPFGFQCFEPMTYQWVRGQLTMAQAADVYNTLASLGCSIIDMPTVR